MRHTIFLAAAALLALLGGNAHAGGSPLQVTASRDAMICSNVTTGNAGAATLLFVGDTTILLERRALIGFDVSTIPSNATVARVRVTLTNNIVGGMPNDSAASSVQLHRVTADWVEGDNVPTTPGGAGLPPVPLNCVASGAAGEVTWDNSGLAAWDAGSSHVATASATRNVPRTTGSFTWDSDSAGNAGLVSDVQSWVDTGNNFGWLLKIPVFPIPTGQDPSTLRAFSAGAAVSLQVDFQIATHALNVAKNGSGSGTVTSVPAGISCGGDCNESYTEGTQVTLSAAAATGSEFTGWSGEGCTGTGTCVVTMTQARNVTATFSLPLSLTVGKDGSGAGTVTSSPAGISCGATCSAGYALNTVVTLTAAAAAGSQFTGWSGAGCSGTGTCVATLSAALSVTATFEALRLLTVTPAGDGSGTVTSAPAGISCGGDCTESYLNDTVVTLSAAAGAGSSFAGWSGAGCSGTGTCVVTMSAVQTVTATFQPARTLTVTRAGAGTGTITSAPAGISCGATCSADFANGTVVTLTAAAAAGSSFVGWSGAGCSGTGTCVVTMSQTRAVAATFEAPQTLTFTPFMDATICEDNDPPGPLGPLGSNGRGGLFVGLAQPNPAFPNANVPPERRRALVRFNLAAIPAGAAIQNVTLTLAVGKAQSPGSTVGLHRALKNWGEGTSVSSGACAVATPGDASWASACTAPGGGTGNCPTQAWTTPGGDFTATASASTNVGGIGSLPSWSSAQMAADVQAWVASPAQNFGWLLKGNESTRSTRCFVSKDLVCPDENTPTTIPQLSVTFVASGGATTATLTVDRAGAGTGTVTSAPAGISCGADCAETVVIGTSLTLSAAPAAGSTFLGWSGGGCSGAGQCLVTVNEATNVTATFDTVSKVLTVIPFGTGTGRVTSAPAGIDCGASGSTCQLSVSNGTVVTLTADPDPGSRFDGWAGDCSNASGPCVVTLSADATVAPLFTASPLPIAPLFDLLFD